MSDEKWDAIVIGSGLGGLTTAAYLTTNGMRTLVLEQYDTAGGSSHVFRRKNKWEFDVGVHYLGDCGPRGSIPTVLRGVGLDGKIDFLPMNEDCFDKLIFPDFEFDVPKGWDKYLTRLIETFPDEEAGLRKCVTILRKIAKQINEGGSPSGILGSIKFVFKSPTVIRWNSRSLGDLFDSCKLSMQARAVLAAECGTYAVPPSRASLILHSVLMDHYLKDGAYYPKGGGQVLAANLVDVIRTQGGDVRTQARVEKIEVDGGDVTGVTLDDGETIDAPVVVSDADIKKTLLEMVESKHLTDKTEGKVKDFRMSLPLFCVYLGLDIDVRDRIPNTNYLIFTDYDIERQYRECEEGRLPDDLPVFITAASVKDPHTEAIAPEGCSNVQIMTVVPPDYSFWHIEEGPATGEKYSRKTDYLAVKEMLTNRLIKDAKKIIPDLDEHIEWKEASTPVTQERFTLASGGTSYGIECSADQFGLKRPKPKTEIGGLYLAGASTVFGHGIAGVMIGGVGCASAILHRNLLEEIATGQVYGDPFKLSERGPDWDPLLASRRLSKKYKEKEAEVEDAVPSEPEPSAV